MSKKTGKGDHAPRTFEWVANNLTNLGLDTRTALAADVFGMVNDKAKIELWRHERVSIYPDILLDVDRWDVLRQSIDYAKSIRDNRLREATRAFAVRVRLNKPWGVHLSTVERADRDALVQALDTGNRYWPLLGKHFDSFLRQLATTPSTDVSVVGKAWEKTVRETARNAFFTALQFYRTTESMWQAYAEAETVLLAGTLYLKSQKSESV